MENQWEMKVESQFEDPYASTAQVDKMLFIARLCSLIPNICPNFQKLVLIDLDPATTQKLTQVDILRLPHMKDGKQFARLSECGEMISKERHHALGGWSDWVCSTTSFILQKTLKNESDSFILSETSWEVVEIEEEGESGAKIESTIRVPCQVSFHLSSLLYRASEEIHRVGSHSLEKHSIHYLVRKVGSSIINSLKDWVSTTELFQNKALQMIFDLKFLTQLLLGENDSKEECLPSHEVGLSLIRKLENYVDPFDLDVFLPHIDAFVGRHVQRA